MMKAIIYTAIGYWLSRQFYERYLKEQQQKQIDKTKWKLKNHLSDQGWTPEEIQKTESYLFNHYEH